MPENPHIESQGQRPKAGGAELDISALDRGRRAPEASTETIAKTQDREPGNQAEQLSKTGSDRRENPFKPEEGKGPKTENPFKPPESKDEQKQTLERHKEQTTTTGFAGPKTYLDANGKTIRGIEQYDKKTGERTLSVPGKDGFEHYKVTGSDGSKTLQKFDPKTGETTGESISLKDRPGRAFQERENRHSLIEGQKKEAAAKTENPQSKGPEKSERGPDKTTPAELAQPKTPLAHKEDNPQGFRPGQEQRPWQKPEIYKPELHREEAQRPHQFERQRPDFRAENPQGIRPGQERPQFRPETNERPSFRPEQRPDFQRPAAADYQDRPNWRHIQDRAIMREMPESAFPQGPRVRDGIFRVQEGRNFNLTDMPRLEARLAALRGENTGAAGEGQGLRLHGRAEASGMLSGLRSGPETAFGERGIHGARSFDLNGRSFADASMLRSLRANSDSINLTNISRGPAAGDFAVRTSAQMPGRTGLDAASTESRGMQKGQEALKAMLLDLAGRQLSQNLLSALNRPADRIPGAEQSKQFVKDLLPAAKIEAQTNNDIALQRNLIQRNQEAGQQNFTIKSQQINNELIAKVKEGDLAGKDLSAARNLDATRTVESRQQNQNNQNVRVAEAANATNNMAEQNKAARREGQDVKENVNTNQVQQNLQTERALFADNKNESSTKAQNSDSKLQNLEDKKQNSNKEEEEEEEEQLKIKKQKETEEKQAEMAALLNNKIKELNEREIAKRKEKEEAQDKNKKDPKQKTRLKYKVKSKDTLSSIAARFLNDEKMAAAIFHINRTVIPVTTHDGKLYALPTANLMIWIPCDDDIDIFKSAGHGKKYADLTFDAVEFASPEEELQARFGRRWYGPDKTESSSTNKPRSAHDQAKRENIEKMLGKIGPEAEAADGRLRYTVRLGEGLKSIAFRHPLLKNVELWKLLAQVNELGTETDEKGFPLAQLKRGMQIMLPTQQEIDAYTAAASGKAAKDRQAVSNRQLANPVANLLLG